MLKKKKFYTPIVNNRNGIRFANEKKMRKSIVSLSMENINNNRTPSALR